MSGTLTAPPPVTTTINNNNNDDNGNGSDKREDSTSNVLHMNPDDACQHLITNTVRKVPTVQYDRVLQAFNATFNRYKQSNAQLSARIDKLHAALTKTISTNTSLRKAQCHLITSIKTTYTLAKPPNTGSTMKTGTPAASPHVKKCRVKRRRNNHIPV